MRASEINNTSTNWDKSMSQLVIAYVHDSSLQENFEMNSLVFKGNSLPN